MPYGNVGRSGWVHDYHFVAQWFPKIGVFWKGAWNAHQFHPTSEFFSDYGVYDVRLTVPQGFVVGATGRPAGRHRQPGRHAHLPLPPGRRARLRLGRRAGACGKPAARFEEPGYPPVDIRLLVQPEHSHLAERYIEATRIALRSYGAWSTPYPFGQVTVVDPAWGSASGGMEYPTLFTGGAAVLAPRAAAEPRKRDHPRVRPPVLVPAGGHQRVRGGLARRGAEQLPRGQGGPDRPGPEGVGQALLRPARRRARGAPAPIPVVAPGVWLRRGDSDLELAPPVGRDRRDGAADLGLPDPRRLHRQRLRQARPEPADAGRPAWATRP